MMELREWRQRLENRVPKLRVYGALTPDLLELSAQRTGDAAFLSWLSERAGESDVIGVTRQLVTTEVSVLVRVTSARGPDEGLIELEAARGKVRAALLGWQPDAADSKVEFRRGQAVAVDPKGVQWWQDVYACEYLICEGSE